MPATSARRAPAGYFAVKRNRHDRVTQVWEYNKDHDLIAHYQYQWKDSSLVFRRDHKYNNRGKLFSVVGWQLADGRPVEKKETFYDFQGQYERVEVTHVNTRGQPAFIETYGEGRKLVSTTQMNYDPARRLDKKKTIYYSPAGNERDFWVTIYTNQNQVAREEHYLSNGTLIAFYRNTYDPLDYHLRHTESFSEETPERIRKDFDADGNLIREEHLTRDLVSNGWKTWTYNEEPGKVIERTFGADGNMIKREIKLQNEPKALLGKLKRETSSAPAARF